MSFIMSLISMSSSSSETIFGRGGGGCLLDTGRLLEGDVLNKLCTSRGALIRYEVFI